MVTTDDLANLPVAIVWQVAARQRLFKRPGFGRTASVAGAAARADEFEARCNVLCDVLSALTAPVVDKVEGPLNFLKADLAQRITDPEALERARDAVGTLQQLVKLRRGQAHSRAAPESIPEPAGCVLGRRGCRTRARARGAWSGKSPAALSCAEVAVRLGHTWASSGPPIWNALYETVRPDVTLIVMLMSGSREVSFRPVSSAGKRWVGLVLRPGGTGPGQGQRV